MRTSTTQFEMLINFMEKNGDLNKPTKEAAGRIQCIQKWETLYTLLNSDPSGDTKTVDKWKKVWSDLKNNTKKKAAKINQAIRGTGGGPALNVHLTEMEKRVLAIIGVQAATGIPGVEEAGVSHSQGPIDQQVRATNSNDDDRTVTLTTSTSPSIFAAANSFNILDSVYVELAGSPAPTPSPSPAHSLPRGSPHTHRPSHSQLPRSTSPPSPAAAPEEHPAHQGRTPGRRGRVETVRVRRPVGTPRRRRGARPQSHVDEAAQHFLRSDEEWRNFLQQKQADEIEIAREKLRVRQMELDIQRKWQEICIHAIDSFNKIVAAKL